MPQRTKVVGTRAPIIWLLIVIALVIIAGLALGGLVVYPRLQKQQAEQTGLTQAEQHYQAGVAFQDVGDWVAAETEYKQVVAFDADYKDAKTRLAEVRTRLAEGEATATAVAIAQAERAQAEAQATATAQAQATAEAQANAQATAAAAPTATAEALEAHYQKGLGYMNMGRWDGAKTELEQIFEVDPNYKEVQAKLAEVEAEVAKLTPTATPEPPTPEATNTPVATATPESLFSDNFDDGDTQGWTVIGSQAKVVDGKYVAIGDPIVVTLAGSETWRNYSVRVKIKTVSGGGDFALLARASEDCRLYLLQFVGTKLRIVRFDGGDCAVSGSYFHSILASISYKLDRGTWYDIRVDVQGTTIIGYVNGAQVISADDAFYSQGKIGLRANDTQMFFDDVEVVPLSKP